MPIAAALATLKSEIAQCDSLIANAHRTEASGLYLFTIRDREQITVAAFLNMFISWEAFLEATILNLMLGCSTVGSGSPIRRVLPANLSDARSMIKGTSRYFDYGNHDYMRTLARLYFENGYPFEPHLSSIHQDLSDLKTMRNSCAHISASTQRPLEALFLRLTGQPQPGISIYNLLIMNIPHQTNGHTIMEKYKNVLLTSADLIANG